MSDISKHLIFVYGTLKRGWGNNVIIRNQEFIGKATTADPAYQMYTLGGFPGVVLGDKHITGEVWLVDDEAFQRCDRLEGNPTFYKRERIPVSVNDKLFQAWIYIYQGDVSKRTKIEEWTHG